MPSHQLLKNIETIKSAAIGFGEWVKPYLPIITFVLGYAFSIIVEQVRTDNAFTNNVRWTQFTKIAETWEPISILEGCADALNMPKNLSTEAGINGNLQKLLNAREDYVKGGKKAFKDALDICNRNRFWLGEDLYYASILYAYELAIIVEADKLPNNLLSAIARNRIVRKRTLDSVKRSLLEGRPIKMQTTVDNLEEMTLVAYQNNRDLKTFSVIPANPEKK